MRAGELRHKIEIQSETGVKDPDSGEIIPGWTTFARVWAEVADLSGREFWDSQQVQSEVSTRVRIRYLDGVKPTMRVIHGSRTLQIEAVIDPDGRRRELQLMAREIQV